MQPKESCSFRRAGFARIHHPKNLGPLIRFDLRFAPSHPASFTRRLKTHPCTLPNHTSLELGEGPEHRKQHFSCWHCRINVLSQAAKTSFSTGFSDLPVSTDSLV